MVPSPADDDSADTAAGPQATDGRVAQLSEEELYATVRVAAEDAVLGAFGTLMLVGIGVVLASWGAALLLSGTPLPAAIGVVLVLFGAYLALSSLRMIPPVREWV
ncbi:hypothetical protein Har1130_02450 [Haloarcula sp. CBA1130]|uniref:hypothetical protein n=1 Tax=unclassified Haloarcula TaxID=2624677 RepID=UPI0012444AB0|nr:MULTISPECIES: hypothetical protein [unclassified Haloarcula]KAA9399961.1 hypothetical protein Har1129_17725 [Haloarcula sp. CBA1129]KAA9401655.1 hypothetical protein Har1130_02450 [Haloarcula sp. CBA1130]